MYRLRSFPGEVFINFSPLYCNMLLSFGGDIQMYFEYASKKSVLNIFGDVSVVRAEILFLRAGLCSLPSCLFLRLNVKMFLLKKLCCMHIKYSWHVDNARYSREFSIGDQFLFRSLFQEMKFKKKKKGNEILCKHINDLWRRHNVSETLTYVSSSVSMLP